MDPIFLFLALPFVLHLVGNYYVDHYADGIKLEEELDVD
jgi:hypothetical protein